ncbi:MAG: COX15/CtaA family protein [Actinomycetota bacterium]
MAPDRYRRVTLAALLSLCAIIVTGAAVRLTGSGLGCSDWPGCEDERIVPPLEFHPWIEFGNRLITGVVSVAVVLAVLGSRWRVPYRRDLVLLSWGLVAGVVAQIFVGAFTVWLHLPPGIVMVHFLLSIVLVWNAVVLHHRAAGHGDPAIARRPALPVAADRATRFLGVWIWIVVVTGTIVTAAGPHRGDPDVEPLHLELGAVARVHGITVVVFLLVTIALLVDLRRRGGFTVQRRAVEVVLVVALLQGVIGYVQYFSGVPALLVGFHIAGATALFVAVVRLGLVRTEPVAVDDATSAEAVLR